MKKLTRVLAIMMSFALLIAISTTAFAGNPIDVGGHTFSAYQIFAGKLNADGTKLSDVVWGSDVAGDKILKELQAYSPDLFGTCTTAADVATQLSTVGDNTVIAKAVAKIVDANKLGNGRAVKDGDTLDAGYYLIVDTTSVDGKTDAKNLSLLQISQNVKIASKSEYVSSEKKVKDSDDTAGTTTDWQDSADWDIGDVIPFQLRGTVASNYADYTTYKYVFHDVESKGLTFNPNSVKVTVGTTDITSAFHVNTNCTDGCTFEIACDDLKAIAGVTIGASDVITVDYTATLNSEAQFGATGNPNEMCLEFSNNVNGEGTGKTQWDKVIVFTYKVVANKITEQKNPLEGAAFELFKKIKQNGKDEYVSLGVVGATKDGDKYIVDPKKPVSFEWKGIDDGEYKLVEVVTPDGYNSIEPIEFKVIADHEILSDNPKLKALTGGDLFKGEITTGAVTGNIVNKTGATLPETGGMGTKIIYVLGTILVIGAAVLLVTKRRMNEE